MRSLNRWIGVLVAILSLAPARGASAAIIFSNFGPGDTYQTNSDWLVGEANEFALNVYGAAFTPAETYSLNTVRLVLNHQGEPMILPCR